jgi:hypothetical protein
MVKWLYKYSQYEQNIGKTYRHTNVYQASSATKPFQKLPFTTISRGILGNVTPQTNLWAFKQLSLNQCVFSLKSA